MKKRKLLNYCGLATALIILLASCEKNDGEIILSSTDMAELSSVTNQSLDITFETTTTWKARCTANWLTFSPKSGEAGRNTITISTTSTNRTKSKRTAHLTIESGGTQKTISVKQRGEYAIFDADELYFPSDGATFKVGFQTNLESDQLLL